MFLIMMSRTSPCSECWKSTRLYIANFLHHPTQHNVMIALGLHRALCLKCAVQAQNKVDGGKTNG
jgi:hypothetical protein